MLPPLWQCLAFLPTCSGPALVPALPTSTQEYRARIGLSPEEPWLLRTQAVPACLRQDFEPQPPPCLHTAGHHSSQVPQVRQEHSSDRQCCPLLPDQFRVPLRAECQTAPTGHPGGAEWHGVLPGGDGEPLPTVACTLWPDNPSCFPGYQTYMSPRLT